LITIQISARNPIKQGGNYDDFRGEIRHHQKVFFEKTLVKIQK